MSEKVSESRDACALALLRIPIHIWHRQYLYRIVQQDAHWQPINRLKAPDFDPKTCINKRSDTGAFIKRQRWTVPKEVCNLGVLKHDEATFTTESLKGRDISRPADRTRAH